MDTPTTTLPVTMPEFKLGAPAASMVDLVKASAPKRVRITKDKPALTKDESKALVAALEATVEPKAKRVRISKAKDVVAKVKAEVPAKRLAPRGLAKIEDATPVVNLEGAATYKCESTPKGYALFTYTLAVFTYLGGFTPARPSMDPAKVVSFFRSKKILNHHAPNLEYTAAGKVRLNVAGWNYFHGRITGSNYSQRVLQPEVDMLVTAFRTGEIAEKTEHFSPLTRLTPIKG